ncbi:MAG: transcription antitermination factor NusB [Flavobacteriales bacterium]|nr:transcription antitermination factor NusB [Flavobacteriales bacterium]
MLTRRHIRLKVMQSLYSYFSNANEIHDISKSEKKMINHFKDVRRLYVVLFSLLIEIINYTDKFLDESKNKFFPKESDLNPNKRFVTNQFSKEILKNKLLLKETNKLVYILKSNDHDLINKLFKELFTSNIYKSYIENENKDISIDIDFIVKVFNNHILNNELLHHILEEESIYWQDDLPFVVTIFNSQIKKNDKISIPLVFKDASDKSFAIDLFRNSIKYNQKYEEIIKKFAKNWDLDRIAFIDKILLKMAFSEIFEMNDLPIKVSINEYIEISKYYSTKKSKMFVNGILDKVVKHYIDQGFLKKTAC